MFLSDYYCPEWVPERWVFSFNYEGNHQGTLSSGGDKIFFLGDRYPHNIIFKL